MKNFNNIKIREYLETRDNYYQNTLKFLKKNNYRKASEFLWGTITQSLKFLAALRNIKIFSHKHFFDFVRDLSKELEEKEFYKTFLLLRDLHENFYDNKIKPEDFDLYLENSNRFMKKLEEIESKIRTRQIKKSNP